MKSHLAESLILCTIIPVLVSCIQPPKVITPTPTNTITSTPTNTITPTITSMPLSTSLPTSTPTLPGDLLTATPTFGIGSNMISEKDDMKMVYVSAGEFNMGSDVDKLLLDCQKYKDDCQQNWFIDEEPPHTVYLNAYWIDQTEVTNAMYSKCVHAGKYIVN